MADGDPIAVFRPRWEAALWRRRYSPYVPPLQVYTVHRRPSLEVRDTSYYGRQRRFSPITSAATDDDMVVMIFY